MNHKVQTAIKASAIVIAMVLASGCASNNNRLDELETKIGMLEQDVAAAKSGSAAAQSTANSAKSAADAARAAAAEGQACCDATNEKIDRMFQRSQSK